MSIIEDGTGSGLMAKVNAGNRLYTRGVDSTEGQQSNFQGNAYNVNTGYITLADAVDTPIMYLKNNEDYTLFIEAIAYGIGTSTGGDTDERPYSTIIRNPTEGTIVSGANDVDISSNRNYGSQNSLSADKYKGATGDTMTGGEDHLLVQLSYGSRGFISINEVLPKGASIGIRFKPTTGNTSVMVYSAIICFLRNPKE